MAELQFKVDQAALNTVRNTPITANFDEMKEALTEFVEPYSKVIISEDAISTAKADRAKLRSVANHIDSFRKAVKSAYSEPLKEFEGKCKELTAIIDSGVSNLDTQVKSYEKRRKEEKIFLLKDYFDNAEQNMKNRGYITWENVYNPKWENTTYSLDTAHKDIDLAIAQTESEVYAIKGLKSEFELSLLDCYKDKHSLSAVMRLHERLTDQKRQQEELRLQREQEVKAMVKESEPVEPLPIGEPAESIPAPEIEQPVQQEQEQLFCATYQVIGTKRELESLSGLFNNLRVKYRTINVSKVGE